MERQRSDYILERRINLPMRTVHLTLLRDATLASETRIVAGNAAELRVAGNLRAVPIASSTSRAWRTTGRLVTPRGRTLAPVEIELSMWASGSSYVQVRPVSRHPERWSARRARGYFAAAHESIDEIVRLIMSGAARDARVPVVPSRRLANAS